MGDRACSSRARRDGSHLLGARRQGLGHGRIRGQPRHRRRRGAQGRLALPHGAVHPQRRLARLRRLPHLLRGPDLEDAGEQAHRRRLPRHEHHADQPGRHRDGRIGSPPHVGAGDDRRRRLDRLSRRVGPRSSREAEGARRLEGHDDDLDVRPPDHPGRRVRVLPAPDRPVPAGRRRLLREGRDRPGDLRPRRRERAPGGRFRSAASRRWRRGRSQRRRLSRAGSRAPPSRAGRDLAAQGLPHPRAPGRAGQSAGRG